MIFYYYIGNYKHFFIIIYNSYLKIILCINYYLVLDDYGQISLPLMISFLPIIATF